MTVRYCIASGSWTDTAIWSTAENGAGGASVPTTEAVFARPFVPTDVTNIPATIRVSLRIENLANVSLRSVAANGVVTLTDQAKFINRGTLRATDGQETVIDLKNVTNGHIMGSSGSQRNFTIPITHEIGSIDSIRISPSHTPATVPNQSQIPDIYLNVGDTVTNPFNRPTLGGSMPDRVGTLDINGNVFVTIDKEIMEIDNLQFSGNIQSNASNLSVTINSPLKVGNLQFIKNSPNASAETCDIAQNADIIFTGNITDNKGNVRWYKVIKDAFRIFSGTENQLIDLSLTIDTLKTPWIADKSGGTLELARFSGPMTGKLYDLELHNAGIEIVDKLIANSVTNNGRVTILQDVVLSTKALNNSASGEIFGEGTLRVPEGGLTNDGFIDPRITLLREDFDWEHEGEDGSDGDNGSDNGGDGDNGSDNGGDGDNGSDNGGSSLSLIGQRVLVIKQSGTLFGIPFVPVT